MLAGKANGVHLTPCLGPIRDGHGDRRDEKAARSGSHKHTALMFLVCEFPGGQFR